MGKYKLKERGNAFALLLNDNELNLLKSSKYIKEKLERSEIPYMFMAVIRHDRDKREDDQNSYKTPHYHMVLQFDGNFAVSSVIKLISELFKVNKNQVSCEKATSIEMVTRYLLHLDDPDKEPYDVWDIETTESNILHRYLKLKIIKDRAELITYVRSVNYDLERIMDEISNYDLWRKYINDLIINYYRKR